EQLSSDLRQLAASVEAISHRREALESRTSLLENEFRAAIGDLQQNLQAVHTATEARVEEQWRSMKEAVERLNTEGVAQQSEALSQVANRVDAVADRTREIEASTLRQLDEVRAQIAGLSSRHGGLDEKI